jgi:glutamine cyclotransferase
MKTLIAGIFLILSSGWVINSCATHRDQSRDNQPVRKGRQPSPASVTRILNPDDNQVFTSGDEILVELECISDTVQLDSVAFFFAGERTYVDYERPFECMQSTTGMYVGNLSIRTIAWYRGGERDIQDLTSVLHSDIQPQTISYQIENSYPHDVNAYTQGLVYHEGYLYEGTGKPRESSLRKVTIRTGDPVRMHNLAEEFFGEGITIFDSRIYQITYRSRVGFVYDLESFRQLQRIYYQNQEGWGLTNDGEHLIMSDGSHKIYYMDTEYFTELKQVEVYDQNGPVSRLNELEYINEKIFANVYGEEFIIIIDPVSGKVTGQLDLQGILAPEDRHSRIDVLNGIAWDPENELLYVTGKYWPKLFALRLTGEF